MAYKEVQLDKNGAEALYKALNGNMKGPKKTKSSTSKSKGQRSGKKK